MHGVNQPTTAFAVPKRPFWKRANRGLLVSAVLLAAVIVYVTVSQLMLIPDKNAVKALADEVCEEYVAAITLSDEQLAALEDEVQLAQAVDALRQTLEPRFAADSPYKAQEPAVTMRDNIQNQLQGIVRYERQTLEKTRYGLCSVLDDVAKLSVSYLYSVDGSRYDPGTGSTVRFTDERHVLEISIVCKKVDDEWKLYRVNWLSRYTDEYYVEGVFGQ